MDKENAQQKKENQDEREIERAFEFYSATSQAQLYTNKQECLNSRKPYRVSYQVIWELVTLWVRNIPVEVKECKWIYERSYMWTAEKARGVLPEKFGRGVRPASQNPYPIYDQNLRFSLPYLWPDQKFHTLFMTWLLDH